MLLPRYWDNKNFGRINVNHPVVGISWYEACAYGEWLTHNWPYLSESKINSILKPQTIRLSLETEWRMAAGGDMPHGRFPWDEPGNVTDSLKDILRRANVIESNIRNSTSVDTYQLGKSPSGVMDMAGNVWEMQSNPCYKNINNIALQGGSWSSGSDSARVLVSLIITHLHDTTSNEVGFRLVIIPGE